MNNMFHDFGFTDEFINRLIDKLDDCGCATEGDYYEIYSVKYREALDLINQMLKTAGYSGKLLSIGDTYCGMAVYGVFDPDKIDYIEAKKYLKQEGHRQTTEI